MRLLWTFMRAYPGQCAVMLVAMLLAGLMEGISLSAFLPLLDVAIGGSDGPSSEISRQVAQVLGQLGLSPTVGVLLGIMFCGALLKNLLGLVARKKVGYTVAQVTTDLRLRLLRALLNTRWQYFLDQRIGSLANAMSSETIRASDAYVSGTMMLALLIQTLVYLGFAFLVSWRATLACLAIGVVVMAVSHGLVVMARNAGKHQTRLMKSLLGRLADTLQSVKPLKAMARESLADRVLQAETSELNQAIQRQVFSSEVLQTTQEVMLTTIVILGVYVALVHWSIPLAEVIMLAVVLGRVLSYLSKVQRQYQKVTTKESAYWSLEETIHRAEAVAEHAGGDVEPHLDREIRLEQVSFAYGDSPVLKELSLCLPAGSFTTLVGPSGVGKTTVVDMVIGLLEPMAGRVLVDGIPLRTLEQRRWRSLIGYVPQENLLLHDSLLANVTLGDRRFSEADVEEALRSAGAWDFVSKLPEGIHTLVGERGVRFSGGQRQRIMIARALVHRPRLLVLDEATSALDPESEAAICTTLRALRGRITVLAISHQSALVEAADRIYRLRDGIAVLERNNDLAGQVA